MVRSHKCGFWYLHQCTHQWTSLVIIHMPWEVEANTARIDPHSPLFFKKLFPMPSSCPFLFLFLFFWILFAFCVKQIWYEMYIHFSTHLDWHHAYQSWPSPMLSCLQNLFVFVHGISLDYKKQSCPPAPSLQIGASQLYEIWKFMTHESDYTLVYAPYKRLN